MEAGLKIVDRAELVGLFFLISDDWSDFGPHFAMEEGSKSMDRAGVFILILDGITNSWLRARNLIPD